MDDVERSPATELKGLTKKYKLFYPDEIMFDGETIQWVHRLTVRQLLFQKIRWIVLLTFVCLVTLLILEPFVLHFAKSFSSIMGPIAFIPLFPFLIVPFFVLFTTDMVDIVTNYRVMEVEVSRGKVITRYLPYCSISGVKKNKSSLIFSHSTKRLQGKLEFNYLKTDQVTEVGNMVENFRAAPPSPPPSKNLKIQSPRFQYELPDPFVDFLRKNKELRGDESRWIYMPKKFEMWKHSILGMLFFCIVSIWILSIALLHFTVHMPHLRKKFGDFIFMVVPVISVVTWAYYNFLLGKIIAAVVLTEKNILTMGYGLWFLFSNSYHNGMYFLVSTPIDKSLGILKVEMNLPARNGRLWASCSTAPFGMLGPNVMTRAEIIFRKQFELAALLSSASCPFIPSSPAPSSSRSSRRGASTEIYTPLPPSTPSTVSASSSTSSIPSSSLPSSSPLPLSSPPPPSPPMFHPPSPDDLRDTSSVVQNDSILV